MALRIDLDLRLDQVLLGGEVALRVTLKNEGDGPVETASLFDNNTITNYVISDAADRVLATVNHVTRQRLLEKVEPRTEDSRLITLAPGRAEVREDNLCRYHWFERPGTYVVRALYRWKGQELISPPRTLEILPAPLRSYDQQWGHHYGEKYFLHSCWLAEGPDGATELFLRESMRFRPQVINHNPSLGRFPRDIAPRVSFDRTLLAGGSVWLAWLGEGEVTALRTFGGRLANAPQRHALPLTEMAWAAPPLRGETDDVIVLVSGVEPGIGRRVLGLQLRPDGHEERRAMLGPALGRASLIRGVCDEDGGLQLFWLSEDARELLHLAVDLSTFTATGAPRRIWQSDTPLLGLFTPPVLTEDSFLSCVSSPPSDRSLRLRIAWLQLTPTANPLKVQELECPGPDAVTRADGEMNQSGHLFAMISTPKAVHYVNGALMQTRTLATPADLFSGTPSVLTVNHRGDVFFSANRRPFGLSETLVHTGTDEDLTESGGDDAFAP